MIRKHFIGVLLVPLILHAACGPPSEEEKIRRFIHRAADLVEKGDVDAVMDLFAPDYTDFEGRDKEAAGLLIADYLRNRRGVVIRPLGMVIEGFDPDGRARVRTEVMLSSGSAEALRRLVPLAGETYRFDLILGRTAGNTWLIRFAEWEHRPAGDLMPESLEVLKKLFSAK